MATRAILAGHDQACASVSRPATMLKPRLERDLHRRTVDPPRCRPAGKPGRRTSCPAASCRRWSGRASSTGKRKTHLAPRPLKNADRTQSHGARPAPRAAQPMKRRRSAKTGRRISRCCGATAAGAVPRPSRGDRPAQDGLHGPARRAPSRTGTASRSNDARLASADGHAAVPPPQVAPRRQVALSRRA